MIQRALVFTASLAVLTAGTCLVAHAQTSSGYGTITTNGLTFTISNCLYTAQGSSTAVGCNPGASNNLAAGDTVTAVASGSAATIEVVNSNGGPVLSLTSDTALGSLNAAKVSLTISVQPSNAQANTTISSISSTVSGTGTAYSDLPLITGGLSWTAGTTNYSLNSSASGSTSGPVTFAPVSSLIFNYDLALNANMGTNPGEVLSLNNATLSFLPAPEPASLLLFGPAALMVTRLRRKRAPRPGKSA